MTRSHLLPAAAPLMLLALAGCPPNVIDAGHNYPPDAGTTSVTTTSGTGGATSTGGAGGQGGALLCTPGAMVPCYSGPAGTEGHGICRAGSRVCAADGMSFGACSGEVLPQAENCATPEDEDCDGKAPPCKGTLLWAKQFGGPGVQQVTSIAVDSSGSSIMAGFFSGSVDFGGGVLTTGTVGAFVAKLDAAGAHVWSKGFSNANGCFGWGVAVDGGGNVLLTGGFIGAVDFGGGPLASAGVATDLFVVKLDASGQHLWSKSFGATDLDTSRIAADVTGRVLLAGSFAGSLTLGGTTLTSAGGRDVFVAKLDSDGSHLWSRAFGDEQDQIAAGVAFDATGNAVLAGSLSGSADFGGGAHTAAGDSDAFVVKLGAQDGGYVWSSVLGDAARQVATGVAVDGSGNVLLSGSFAGEIAPGGSTPVLASEGDDDIFVVKLGATGSAQWARRFGDASEQEAGEIAVDAGGNLVLAGTIDGAPNFGDGPLQCAGNGDVVSAKLDAGGGYLWAKRFGDAAQQLAAAVAMDANRNVLLTGQFTGTVDFGGGPLTSAGAFDIFIAKFSE